MPRRISQSQLELFVIAYLKRIRAKSTLRRERKFIIKAIAMIIAITADSPCCQEDPEPVLFGTPNDNTLTNTIRTLISGIDRRKHGKSIQRTLLLLNQYLYECCVNSITYELTSTGAQNPLLKFKGENGVIYKEVTEDGATGQVFVPENTRVIASITSEGTGETCNTIILTADGIDVTSANCLQSSFAGCIEVSFIAVPNVVYTIVAYAAPLGTDCDR